MENITPEAEALGLTELLEAVQAQLKDLRMELVTYTEEARAGGDMQTTKIKDALLRAKGLVQQCTGLEKLLAESRQRHSGGPSGSELDLDLAKSEVGRALDRIRACRDTEPVSG